MRKTVLSIAATDGSGHAGLFNDLRVFSDLGVHGAGIVTGLTYQNSQEMTGSELTKVESLQQQWSVLQDDLNIAAIKVGLLLNEQQLIWLRILLAEHPYPVVLDPVLSSSVGGQFGEESTNRLRDHYLTLLQSCSLIIPNIPEAEWLLQTEINNADDVEAAAQQLRELGAKAVLIKGGHLAASDSANSPSFPRRRESGQPPTSTGVTSKEEMSSGLRCEDYFSSDEAQFWLSQPKLDSDTDRGTGCMLSSAIAAFYTHGKPLHDAVVLANAYVNRGMQEGFKAGEGRGVLANTGWPDQFEYFPAVSDHAGYQVTPAFASCETNALGLYPVVDSVEWLEKLLKLGVKTLQIRVKNRTPEELDQIVARSAALGREYDARLFINDYWELAIKHDAYGVHLGQEDMVDASLQTIREAGLRLGLSTHGEFEWARATAVKPSYVALGAVFPTDTKPVQIIGLENLHEWVTVLQPEFPVTAIGGINDTNLDSVLATGVRSVAVVSAVTKAEDYVNATQDLQRRIEHGSE